MRLYQTEFGLTTFFNYKTIIPASHLELLEDEDNRDYHIYGILLAPKFFYKPDSVICFSDHFEITIFSNSFEQYSEYTIPVCFAKDLNHNKLTFDGIYPYSALKVNIDDEDWLSNNDFDKTFEIQISELFDHCSNALVDRLKYKVLYIGQAYGKRGERSAIDRLSSHDTFQKILIDSQRNYPECELKLLLLEINYRVGMGIANSSIPTIKDNAADNEHIKNVTTNLPEYRQVINITEAALINYFKPEYNSTFIENFPSNKHKTYHQYYELDYNELIVEVDMEFDNFPFIELYSDTASINSVWDFIHYKINNDINRVSMYDMFQEIKS